MVYAAGILILSIYNGKCYVLLGKDHYETYSDFGGKSEYVDRGISTLTASRETYEETCGVLYNVHELKNKLKNCSTISSLSYTNKPYLMYILFVKYDEDISNKFANVKNYIKNIQNMEKFKEKTEIKWFLLQTVLDNKIELRNIFKKTINTHKNMILKIACNYISRNTYYNYGRHKV